MNTLAYVADNFTEECQFICKKMSTDNGIVADSFHNNKEDSKEDNDLLGFTSHLDQNQVEHPLLQQQRMIGLICQPIITLCQPLDQQDHETKLHVDKHKTQ